MVLWYHLCDMWAHFVVYIWTRWCKCHVQGHVRLGVGHSGRGSGIFGWWWAAYKISLHLWVDSLSQIPLYAGIKIWNNFISPMVLGRSPAAARTEEPNEKEALSKRQEKLRKKSERGDPRIKVGKRWICASVGAPCVEMHHILRPRFNNQLSAVMGTVDSLSRTHDLQWLKPREQLQAERVYVKSRKPFWFDRQPRRLIVPLGESRLLLFYCGKVYGIIYTSRTTSSTHKDLACLDICTNGDGLLQCTQLSGPNQAWSHQFASLRLAQHPTDQPPRKSSASTCIDIFCRRASWLFFELCRALVDAKRSGSRMNPPESTLPRSVTPVSTSVLI